MERILSQLLLMPRKVLFAYSRLLEAKVFNQKAEIVCFVSLSYSQGCCRNLLIFSHLGMFLPEMFVYLREKDPYD